MPTPDSQKYLVLLTALSAELKTLELKSRASKTDISVATAADLSLLLGKTARRLKLWPVSKIELLKAYRELTKNGSSARGTTLPPRSRSASGRTAKRIGARLAPSPALELFLKRRGVRSMSGVAVISVLTKPYPCPGKCAYCPHQKDMPVSYLSNEPAVMRAVGCHFDPYIQVQSRLQSLKLTGHPTDKLELIVIGGTWSYLPKNYQTWFIKRCFQAANDHKSTPKRHLPSAARDPEPRRQSGHRGAPLSSLQHTNERARHRIIGITLETRPDYITPAEIARMRALGCTRVELGIQIVNDPVLKLNHRGHTVAQVRSAMKLLKDAGFKICVHIMPNLPGATPASDLTAFKTLFADPDFHPDMLKIYPTVVVKGSLLYRWWRAGKYRPYSDQTLLKLLLKFKTIVPIYTRINRLIRDIPNTSIKAGNKIANLREVLQSALKKTGTACRCIRCREIKDTNYRPRAIKLQTLQYESSGGQEYFLSYEDPTQDKLLAFLRLRLPACLPSGMTVRHGLPARIFCHSRTLCHSRENGNLFAPAPHFLPELTNAALIREVHTYGHLVEISHTASGATQHSGWGKKLITQAETIAKKHGYQKMAVISGVGVRGYYQKLGYRLEGTYMVKKLR